jgi:uncharacterized protein (TIGR03435 family)
MKPFVVLVASSLCVNPILAGRQESAQVAESYGKPVFEVASVRPSQSGERTSFRLLPERFIASGVPVEVLLHLAFQVRAWEVEGLPAWATWIGTERFDIVANTGGAGQESVWRMLQSLLEDRFGLTWHREVREDDVYALTRAGRGGPRSGQFSSSSTICDDPAAPIDNESLRDPGRAEPIASPSCFVIVSPAAEAGTGRLRGVGQPTRTLADALTSLLDRRVIDRSGLAGTFDFEVVFRIPQPRVGVEGTDLPATAPDLFSALEEQLALRLEPARGPVDVFVVDHIERPGPN